MSMGKNLISESDTKKQMSDVMASTFIFYYEDESSIYEPMTVENFYTVIAMNLQLPMSLATCQSNKPNA